MYITVPQAKTHLQVDAGFKGDDEYILALVRASEDAIEQHLCVPLASIVRDGSLPASVIQAVLLMVGNLYANREPVSYSTVAKVPYTLEFLLAPYKRYSMP